MKNLLLLITLLGACTSGGPLVFRPEVHGMSAPDVPQAWTDRVAESAKRWSNGLTPRCGTGMVTVSPNGLLSARLVPVAVFVYLGGDEFSGGHGTGGITRAGDGFGISGELDFLASPKWALESIQHEMGHNLGLAHSTDPESIMYPVDRGLDMSPSADDLNAAADLLGCGGNAIVAAAPRLTSVGAPRLP